MPQPSNALRCTALHSFPSRALLLAATQGPAPLIRRLVQANNHRPSTSGVQFTVISRASSRNSALSSDSCHHEPCFTQAEHPPLQCAAEAAVTPILQAPRRGYSVLLARPQSFAADRATFCGDLDAEITCSRCPWWFGMLLCSRRAHGSEASPPAGDPSMACGSSLAHTAMLAEPQYDGRGRHLW
jgi:hypothetical protein